MTGRIDFYVLKSSNSHARLEFACRLTEKAYAKKLEVVVLSDTAADAAALDDLLWTFDDRAFVPHRVQKPGASTAPDAKTRVHVAVDLAAFEHADVLINLSGRVPEGLHRFKRVAEIVDADDARRRLGRDRFKAYRDLGLPLETHQS